MKKLLKTTAFLLGFAMVLCALPAYFTPAEAGAATVKTYLKGDYNCDAAIDAADVNYFLGIVKDVSKAPAKGTDEYKRLNIVGDKDGFTMEDVRRVARVANGKAPYTNLYYDKAEENTYGINFFNSLVNVIKTDSFKSHISYFLRITSKTETKNFAYSGLLKLMQDKISEEYKQMDGTTVEYSRLIEDTPISNNGMPCFEKDYVSALSADDIASIKIENGAAVDILKGYGDSYLREASKKVYDITRYKAPVSNTIKVTVTLKQENKDGVSKLPTAENGGTTALMRGYGTDVRNIIQEGTFNKTEPVVAGVTMNMDMKCVNLKSDCKIVYFFDAKTLAPVAAGYTVGIVSDQSVTVKVNMSEGEYASFDNSFHFEPTSTSIYDYYYFFSNAYPIAD